jgi:hypothetical protein
MRRCLGITRNLHRCGRTGDWRWFCHEHRQQPIVWLSFIVFTVAAGGAQLYSTWWPQPQSDPEMARWQKRLEGLQTGGDSYALFMLYYFDMPKLATTSWVCALLGEGR